MSKGKIKKATVKPVSNSLPVAKPVQDEFGLVKPKKLTIKRN